MTRTGIVTGGAQGIGKGIVQHLIAEGWRVAAIDKDGEAVRDLAAEMPNDRLLSLEADVSNETAVAKAFEAIGNWLKGDTPAGIDLLVSNAGLADPVSGPIEDLTLKNWHLWQVPDDARSHTAITPTQREHRADGIYASDPVGTPLRGLCGGQGRVAGAQSCARHQPGTGYSLQRHSAWLDRDGSVGEGV